MHALKKQIATLGAVVVLLGGCAGAGQKTGEAIDDSAITTKVKASFAKDPDVSAMKVHVDTDKGVVTLSGDVKSSAEKEKAGHIARNTSGVRYVNNNLAIRTN